MPSLSVVMPNRNHACYIAEALDAILGQSLPPTEVLVIDDASTDDSVAVIEQIASRDPRVRLVSNAESVGPMVAEHRALGEISGEYVFFAGADDRVLPGFFEATLALLARHPQAGMCSTLSRIIDESGKDCGIYPSPVIAHALSFVSPAEGLRLLTLRGPWFMGNASVYRRQAVIDSEALIPELGSLSDGFLQQVLTLRHGACYIPEPLACWRRMVTGFAATDNADWQRRLNLRLRAAQLMRSAYHDLFPEAYVLEWEQESLFAAGIAAWRVIRRQQQESLRQAFGRLCAPPTRVDRMAAAALGAIPQVQTPFVRLYLFLRFKGAGWWLRRKVARAVTGGVVRA